MPRTGRPTRYAADLARLARQAYEIGATDHEVAALIGIHHDTLRRWRHVHPEFAQAKEAGRALADRRVELSMYRRAIGYDYTETRVFLPFGAKEPVAVDVTRHKHAEIGAGFRWLAMRKPDEWGGRDAPEEKGGLAERLAQALANVAAGRAGDDNG